ncbi:MAG: thermonuclease family protein, partial [Bacteriovoracaceae bacterium]|nr:thermonuclease family protein [Bacteriovoracaceae bacterium]
DLEEVSRGKYFRMVAKVKVDGQDLSEKLLKNGLAYPYFGKTKKKIDWCKGLRLPASQN